MLAENCAYPGLPLTLSWLSFSCARQLRLCFVLSYCFIHLQGLVENKNGGMQSALRSLLMRCPSYT